MTQFEGNACSVVDGRVCLSVERKCGVVALMGETNAGKSTLINALVGQKVSIVSRKIQTTLGKTVGIVVRGGSQVVLLDTPGFIVSGNRNLELSEKIIWSACRESDEVLLLVDVSRVDFATSITLLRKIDAAKKISLVLNKIDLIPKPKLLEIASMFGAVRDLENVFMTSSLYNSGVSDIVEYLAVALPSRNWMYEEDQVTDATFEQYVSEITREHIYNYLHQEIPYNCKVEVESCKNQADGSLRLVQNIYVNTQAHRKIFLGRGGRKIRTIGTAARKELSQLLNKPVHLFLHVYEKRPDSAEKPQ